MVPKYHYVMSLSWTVNGRPAQGTYAGIYEAGVGDTEDMAYKAIHAATYSQFGITGNATVLFYRLTKNSPGITGLL